MNNPTAPDSVTVGAILEGYLKERKGKVRSHDTLRYACAAIQRHLGNLEPEHLKSATVHKYAEDRRSEGVTRTFSATVIENGQKRTVQRSMHKPIADGTIAREIQTLRAALKWAFGERWISAPPPVKMPVRASKPRERWLTKDEARSLVDGCASPHAKLFVRLALSTAARAGAILELTWDQVDLTRGLIDLGEGNGNKRRSVVPITQQLRAALEEAKTLSVTEYVIESKGKPVKSVKTAFQAAVKRARLDDTGVVIHTLRHTAATWMVQAGVPLAEVARLLGDSEKIVEKVYGKHTPEYLRRAVGALEL